MRQDILPFRGKYAKLRIIRKNRIKEKAGYLFPFLFSLTSQLLRAISLPIEKASKIVKRYIKERGQATFLQEVYFLRRDTLFLRR